MTEPSTSDLPSEPEGDDLLAAFADLVGAEADVLDEIDALLTRLLEAAAAEPEPEFDPDAIWAQVEHQVWGR